jgi:hypothetical protein
LTLDKTGLRTRAATIADTVAIAEIYNQGIADRIATFEIEPRSAADIAEWFTRQHLVMVAETREAGPIAFAASFPYSSWACYSGIREFSGTRRRTRRARCVNRSSGGARDAQAYQPCVSRKRCEPRTFEGARFRGNRDSPAARTIGCRWRDCVIVELLLPRIVPGNPAL